MFYQLAYKIIDDRMTELEITNMITRLDYKHAQQLSWTSGHFIIACIEHRILKTLVAFPHYKKLDQELILIQEYILDRLGINFEELILFRWISRLENDIEDEYNLLPNNLIIRTYHQEYFFKKILQISIHENSPSIAAMYYSNYYFNGTIQSNRIIEESVSTK